MKITFEPAIDLAGHPMTLTVILDDGHGLRATLHDLTDAGVPALFRATARAIERHLSGEPDVIIGPAGQVGSGYFVLKATRSRYSPLPEGHPDRWDTPVIENGRVTKINEEALLGMLAVDNKPSL